MKKLLYVLTTVLVLFMFSNTVFARTAKIPDQNSVPEPGDILNGITDTDFDFSAIEFATAPTGNYISGDTELQKIILFEEQGASFGTGEYVGYQNAFTAYCLDSRLKYPIYYTFEDETSAVLFKIYAAVALYDDSRFEELFKGVQDFYEVDDQNGVVTPSAATLAAFENGEEVTAEVNYISFRLNDESVVSITAEQLTEATGATYTEGNTFSVSIKKEDHLNNKFITLNMPDTLYYNKALWIIEHSYPTLSLPDSLSLAGASLTALTTELGTLFPEQSAADLAITAENFVYATVQYAIWRVENVKVTTISGIEYHLGDSLRGSSELNKLYQYLIKDRDAYTGYGSTRLTNTFEVNKPTDEIYKETSSAYIYGPYSVKTTMLTIGNAALSITSTDKKGVTIIDKEGNEISTLKDEEEFYIKTTKSAKISNVKVTISTTDGIKFDPETNRGRIYKPFSILDQKVGSGGVTVPATATQEIEFVYNPKTGIEDAGLILLITLAAFIIGYIALGFKNKPLEI